MEALERSSGKPGFLITGPELWQPNHTAAFPHLAVFTEKSLSEVVPRGQRGTIFAFPTTTRSYIFLTKLMKTKSIAVDKQVRTKCKRKADPQDRKQDSFSQLPLAQRLVFHKSTIPTPSCTYILINLFSL